MSDWVWVSEDDAVAHIMKTSIPTIARSLSPRKVIDHELAYSAPGCCGTRELFLELLAFDADDQGLDSMVYIKERVAYQSCSSRGLWYINEYFDDNQQNTYDRVPPASDYPFLHRVYDLDALAHIEALEMHIATEKWSAGEQDCVSGAKNSSFYCSKPVDTTPSRSSS